MKKFYLIILIFLFTITMSAQEETSTGNTSEITSSEKPSELSEEQMLCKEAAEEIMKIYDNWDSSENYKILYPRIKEFVTDFYDDFPEFTKELFVKEKSGEKLTDYERRTFVAYKGLKESVYEEISRYSAEKDFYWGYIDEDISSNLKLIAKKLGDHSRANSDKLLKDQEVYIQELLDEMRKNELQLDSLKNISDLKVIDDLLDDEQYNNDMMLLQYKRMQLSSQDEKSKLDKFFVDKLNRYIEEKRSELIDKKRNELISSKEYWLEEKRATMFDLLDYESRRISKIVTEYLDSLKVERNIKNFDISDEFLLSIKDSNDSFEQNFNDLIKYKFYSGLVGKFGFYIQYEYQPLFRSFRLNVFVGTILFMMLFVFIFRRVKRSKDSMFIRRIPGLDAIDDAIGRATEMGRPIVYDSGIGAYSNIDTIASMLILKSVAKKVAEFKAEIYVPTCDPVVMQISEEMVASGFLDAGYPEDHKKDNVFYLAADQFAFAAGIAGLLARKKPATALHFGFYLAESLLIAEAGFSAGAIQVAGTTSVGQLPFFITACDYTLIGEELYAAAAYISRDAQILTNLKLSDYAKITIGILFIIGTIFLTINSEWTFLQDLVNTR
ncbi:MAG: hypothetical protein JXR69_01505 [Candidatus Delongbacteria bacterium]|nr:hypothetical protein [Candidatus Delongbacteria bacterium]